MLATNRGDLEITNEVLKMTIQTLLNTTAISFFPKVKSAIESAEGFEANQMNYATVQACNNSVKPIDSMTKTQLEKFEADLIESFQFKNWIN
jgi:intracellular sulfur oxidation DsrE/DsrF family protein